MNELSNPETVIWAPEIAASVWIWFKLICVMILVPLLLVGPLDVLRSRRARGWRKLGWFLLVSCLPVIGWIYFQLFVRTGYYARPR